MLTIYEEKKKVTIIQFCQLIIAGTISVDTQTSMKLIIKIRAHKINNGGDKTERLKSLKF